MSTLSELSWRSYVEALTRFVGELHSWDVLWQEMSSEDRDAFLSDDVLEQLEEGAPRQQSTLLIEALHKFLPQERFRTANAVLCAWSAHLPPRQAPAVPREVACAVAVALVFAKEPRIGTGLRLCFSGLLRIGEALAVRWRQVLFLGPAVLLWLGRTKSTLR